MPTCEDVLLLAHYNAGMNRKLYDAAAQLPPRELHADRKAFFGSVLGTLNHLVATDTIWLKRFAAHPSRFAVLDALRDGVVPNNLTQSYGDDLATLRAHRMRLDAVIGALAAELRQPDLDQALAYQNSRGVPFKRHFGSLLLHFFNHQTHHRGQATTLLTQAGVDVGVTDLLESIPNLE